MKIEPCKSTGHNSQFCKSRAVVINSTPVLLFGIVRILNIWNPNPCLRKAGWTLSLNCAYYQPLLRQIKTLSLTYANNYAKIMMFLRKYWKQIAVAVAMLLIVSGGLTTYNWITTTITENKAFKDANSLLDARERRSRSIMDEQAIKLLILTDSIETLNESLATKKTKLIKIHSDVQLLKGDSIAIVRALDRVFTDKADSRNIPKRN